MTLPPPLLASPRHCFTGILLDRMQLVTAELERPLS